ncbi:GNAT family N-acetyltransferase [Trinickia terrae]|uniref:Acyl-homoserine-lactone synthase n=1 Tax=Trinickia terrae TaxID=2571161 RepID=A0A4U1IFX5_9BURK|nr:acyl-homoserine-lactone synthase [Trinickia terrae]TKC92666.1 GNAT family N-acetyltransferase [Trinickia terrae]
MQTSIHGDGRMPAHLDTALAHYRHRIFVQQLGWDLPGADEHLERDQYDRDDTVYVVAHDESGSICGCARLLPTNRPYLLQEFPFLLADGMPAPNSSDVWEVSRLAASPDASDPADTDAACAMRPMMAAVVECAAKRGARQLIAVTFLSMERLLRRIGLHVHRAGPAQRIDGRMVVALLMDIDAQTLGALNLDPSLCTVAPALAA